MCKCTYCIDAKLCQRLFRVFIINFRRFSFKVVLCAPTLTHYQYATVPGTGTVPVRHFLSRSSKTPALIGNRSDGDVRDAQQQPIIPGTFVFIVPFDTINKVVILYLLHLFALRQLLFTLIK